MGKLSSSTRLSTAESCLAERASLVPSCPGLTALIRSIIPIIFLKYYFITFGYNTENRVKYIRKSL